MRVKWGLLGLLATAILPALIAACGEDPTPTRGRTALGPTPDARATVEALARAGGGTPTPTPISAEDSAAVVEYAIGHSAVTQDWEAFHATFDAWRAGLIACEASSFQVALGKFAGRFSDVARPANALPRHAQVRTLADSLVQSLESEAAALRRLRDEWQPGDPSLFELVETERSAASALQKELEDQLNDLLEVASAASRQLLGAYTPAFQELNARWDAFHQSYDRLRSQQADLSSPEVVQTLGRLVEDFNAVGDAVRDLPTSEITQLVTEALAQAAQDEELLLRRLRGSFEASDTGPEGETILTSLDPTLFDAFDAQLVQANSDRRLAATALESAGDRSSEDRETAIQEFRQGLLGVLALRDSFYAEYDRWRSTEGSCNVSQAIATLAGFVGTFGDIASRVRGLPRSTVLRPLGELMVEAAEGEERAVRVLRDIWHPFDPAVYAVLEAERSAAGRLRRQVTSSLQDLLARHGTSQQDLSR